MQRRLAHFLAVTSFIVAVAYSAALAQRPVPPRDAAQSAIGAAQSHQAVLGKYCITCHNQRTKTGGLALDTLPLTDVRDHAEEWEKVVRKVRTGAMPPVGRARPDKTSAEGLVTWLEAELDRAATERLNPGRPTLQRLNRNEYTNAVRDLLAVELDAASLLPADVAGYGFDNNADALTLSPALTERYLGAAAKIGQMALGRPRGLPTPETFFVPSDSNQGLRISDDLPFGSRGGLARALLLSCRWRVSVRDAAERDRCLRRIRGGHRGAASTLRESRQRPGLDRNHWRTGVRARSWRWRRCCWCVWWWRPRQEGCRFVAIQRAGKGGVTSGAGLLRCKDIRRT